MRPTFYPTVWFRGKLPRRSVPRPQSFADSLLRFGLPGHQLTVCRQTAYLVCGLIAEASVGGRAHRKHRNSTPRTSALEGRGSSRDLPPDIPTSVRFPIYAREVLHVQTE